MPRVGFEPTISAGERPKTYALDRAATETSFISIVQANYKQTDMCLKRMCYIYLSIFLPNECDLSEQLEVRLSEYAAVRISEGRMETTLTICSYDSR